MTYTKEIVKHFICNIENIKGSSLAPDHDLFLQVYDIETAIENIFFTDYETRLIENLKLGLTLKQTSKVLDTSIATYKDNRSNILGKITDYLNGGGTDE